MKSIFDVLGDYYYGNTDRSQSRSSHVVYKLPITFIKQRIRKDLFIEQKIIVFRFMVALHEAIDIDYNNPTLF